MYSREYTFTNFFIKKVFYYITVLHKTFQVVQGSPTGKKHTASLITYMYRVEYSRCKKEI